MKLVTFDFETHPIAFGAVYPQPVCVIVNSGEESVVITDGDEGGKEGMVQQIAGLLADESLILANHSMAFDLGVLCAANPMYVSQVYQAIIAGRVVCTLIREKMLTLAQTGDLSMGVGDVKVKLLYDLASVMMRRFSIDRSEAKDDESSWRRYFGVLSGVPGAEYPQGALDYLTNDGDDPYRLYLDQEQRRSVLAQEIGCDPLAQQSLRMAQAFSLGMMSAYGVCTDASEHQRIKQWATIESSGPNVDLLIQNGMLVPAQPPREHLKIEGRMVKAQPEKMSTKIIREYILGLHTENPELIPLLYSDPSTRFPDGQISFAKEWLDEVAHLDPVLSQIQHRQAVQKILNTDLPRMTSLDAEGEHTSAVSPVVYVNYDVLKETGRTSSFAGTLYPSFSCQNVHPDVAGVIVPRSGYLFLSIDYQQLELVTLGQTLLNLFGTSMLAKLINEGVDLHAYLGAQIAMRMSLPFQQHCINCRISEAMDVYRAFKGLKDHSDPAAVEIYGQYRKLAKPTGLGYPGGLGAKTMVAYAHHTYGVKIDYDTAALLKQIWFDTFPEMRLYFKHITKDCRDTRNGPRMLDRKGPSGVTELVSMDLYEYTSPLGLFRGGCAFTAAANGIGLQTPAADGASLATISLVRACRDPNGGYPDLLPDSSGVRLMPVLFIHDEFVSEIRDCEEKHLWIPQAQQIMVDAMRVICPDVAVRTDACLMDRWNKKAQPVFDDLGRLSVWKPKKAGSYV